MVLICAVEYLFIGNSLHEYICYTALLGRIMDTSNHSFEQPRSRLHNATSIKQHLLLPNKIGFRLCAEIMKLNYDSAVPSYCICLHGLKLVLLAICVNHGFLLHSQPHFLHSHLSCFYYICRCFCVLDHFPHTCPHTEVDIN